MVAVDRSGGPSPRGGTWLARSADRSHGETVLTGVVARRPHLIPCISVTELGLPALSVTRQWHEVDGALVTVGQTPDPCAQVAGPKLLETRSVSQPHVVVVPGEGLLVRRLQSLPLHAVSELAGEIDRK